MQAYERPNPAGRSGKTRHHALQLRVAGGAPHLQALVASLAQDAVLCRADGPPASRAHSIGRVAHDCVQEALAAFPKWREVGVRAQQAHRRAEPVLLEVGPVVHDLHSQGGSSSVNPPWSGMVCQAVQGGLLLVLLSRQQCTAGKITGSGALDTLKAVYHGVTRKQRLCESGLLRPTSGSECGG